MICQTSVAILSVTLFVGGVTPKLAAQSVQSQSQDGQAAPVQGPPTQRLSATTERLEFEVASIRQNKSDAQPYANFSIGPGTMYNPTGGMLSTPAWALSDGFDIHAKSENHDPTKDQMRLMMQSLLADRFKLVVHTDTRQVPVFALVLAKPGVIGAQLKPHPADKPCSTADPTVPAPDPSSAPLTKLLGAWPRGCGGVNRAKSSVSLGLIRTGARNVSMEFLAGSMNGIGNLNRPVLDQTGLTGNFDFVLEFAPEIAVGENPGNSQPDPEGPMFEEALKKQLGLKLDPQKGTVDYIHVDHVEHPTDN